MADESVPVEVIYKGWLKKATLSEGKKKSFLNRQSSTWKRRYFVLLRKYDDEEEEECSFLYLYEKEPAKESDQPKASLKLWPHYRVDKKHDSSGKTFVFEVRTPEDSLRLQAETETNMDLWVFYIQIQTKLRQDFPGYCFEVTPEESDPMRRIGAKGSKCLLHMSKWGLTLALKRTRSLLAQWPLKSIRIFESSETGAFSFEAGRSAPMGEARYLFGTLQGEDGKMYDLLDAYTTEMQELRNDGTVDTSLPATEEEIVQEYEKLRLATFGLLNQRSSSVSSAVTPSASVAVPVPVPHAHCREPTLGYDHLHRAQEEIARQQSERQPIVPSRTRGIPIQGGLGNISVPQRAPGPPLPPRQEGLQQPPSSLQRSYSERGQSLERYGRSMEGRDHPIYPEEEPYTSMTPSSSFSRGSKGHRSFTESDLQQFVRAGESLGNIAGAEKFRRMLSNNPNNMSEYEAMALRLGHNPYQNSGVSLLPNSYENTPLISPSPRDGMIPGFPNMGFVSSPQSVETGPPILPRKYQLPHKTHTDSDNQNVPIRHTYFQYQFNREPLSSASSMRAGAMQRPPSETPGYFSIKGGTLGSHQYQEVNLYNQPQRTLRRSLSLDQFFMSRSHSFSSSVSSAFSVGSPLIGSLDLAVGGAKASKIPDWMRSRQLPSPPPPGTHTPEFNSYCGSPKASSAPLVDFRSSGAAAVPYGEIKRNRNSFNNNNRGQTASLVGQDQTQLEVKENLDASMESGYLEPIFKMKRSRSEGDILDAVESSTVPSAETPRGKKSRSKARNKSRGFFATLRKRTNSTPEAAVPESTTNDEKPQSTVTALIKRSQSNSDLLGDKPVAPRQYNPVRSNNVAAVKPASHLSVAAPVNRQKKFDFSLKIFRQSSKSSDREEGGNENGGSEEENKSEKRNSKSSPSDVKLSGKTQAQSAEKSFKSPGVKGIVASEKTISFVKNRSPGTGAQGQSPTSKPKPPVASKPKTVPSPSSTVNPEIPRMQSLSPESNFSTSPSSKAARERLKEVVNRPLPSPPQTNTPVLTTVSSKPHVKKFVAGMKHSQLHDISNSPPDSKTNRVKKTPPAPPPRDPSISLDTVSLKSSSSNASDYKNVVMTRRSSTDVESPLPPCDPDRRKSVESGSLRSSRTNSTGSQYENTDFGSLGAGGGTPPGRATPPGSLPDRSPSISIDGVSVSRSASFTESHRRLSAGSGSHRSSNGSQYENTDLGSVPTDDVASSPGSLPTRNSQTFL